MAGNAHANRHGHRPDCRFCKTAIEKIVEIRKAIVRGREQHGLGALARFDKNCKVKT